MSNCSLPPWCTTQTQQEQPTDNPSIKHYHMKRSGHSPARKVDDESQGIAQAPSPKKRKPSAGTAEDDSSSMQGERQQPPPAIVAAAKMPYDPHASKGGARIRLPDKLMEYLNNEVEKDVLWWQPDGDGFAFDSKTVQKEFLDKHFEGTKLKSFIRSLNRWGFRRIFYHTLPKSVYAFHHSLFKKGSSELTRQMKMLSYSGQQALEMEEFNKHQRGSVPQANISASEDPMQASPAVGPAQAALAPAPFPQVPAHQLPQYPMAVQAATLPQGGYQSLLSNPLYSSQVLQGLQDQQALQQQQQQQEQLQLQQMAQQQQQQQLSGLLVQAMLNMSQQQPHQQLQPQPLQQPQQLQHQQQLQLQQQLQMIQQHGQQQPAAGSDQMFLQPNQPPPAQQGQDAIALAQLLGSQQRMDGVGSADTIRESEEEKTRGPGSSGGDHQTASD